MAKKIGNSHWASCALLLAMIAAPCLAQNAPSSAPSSASSPGAATHPSIPAHPALPAPQSASLYVALGDSITFGVGTSPNCQPLPRQPADVEALCPDGKSYTVQVALALRKQGMANQFLNLGIGGAHVSKVISDELPMLPANASIVTIYIGTNDSRAVRSPKHTVADVTAQFSAEFAQLIDRVRTIAPAARIVLINIPNEKYLNGPDSSYNQPPPVLEMYSSVSAQIDAIIDSYYPRYGVVDLACNPHSYDGALMYKKTVHPNNDGAAYVAQAVLDVLLADHPAPPAASCRWFQPAGQTASAQHH